MRFTMLIIISWVTNNKKTEFRSEMYAGKYK